MIIFKSFIRIILIIILAVIVLLSVAKYKLVSVINEDQIVRVPNLVGMDVLEASDHISKINENLDKKIHLKLSPIINDNQLKYTVLKQDPNPKDMPIKEGRTITLQVSKGSQRGKIPNYIGKSFYKVRRELLAGKIKEQSVLKKMKAEIRSIILNRRKKQNDKLNEINDLINGNINPFQSEALITLGSVIFTHDPIIEKGHIIRQKPEADSQVFEDTQMDFVVSLGNNEDFYIMDQFIGKRIDTVVKILSDQNIFIDLKSDPKSTKESGTVLRQSIKTGIKVFPGDKVELIVSNLSPNSFKEKYHLIKFVVPTEFNSRKYRRFASSKIKSLNVRLIVKDETGEKTLFEGRKAKGDKIIEAVRIVGKGKAYIYLGKLRYKIMNLE